MKVTLLIVFFLAFFAGFTQTKTIDKRKSYFCHARGGLTLRTAPSLSAEKDTTISYADEIKLVSKSDSTFKLNGLEGSWYQVAYNNIVGFVFSAYLSTISIKVKNNRHVYLKDFAFENLIKTSGDDNFKMSDDQSRHIKTTFGANKYECKPGGYCDLDETLYLEGTNVQEVFIIIAAYLKDYNEYNFNPKNFHFDKSEGIYRYQYNKQIPEGFDLEIFNSYKLNIDKSYHLMSTSFEWEGGGGTLIVSKWNDSMLKINHTYYCH